MCYDSFLHVTKALLRDRDLSLLTGFAPSCVCLRFQSCFGFMREGFESVLGKNEEQHKELFGSSKQIKQQTGSKQKFDFWLQLINISRGFEE